MQSYQIYLSQSLRRVQQFLTAHADAVQAANASDARKQLDTAVVTIDAAAAEQGTCSREVRGEVQKRKHLEDTLVRRFLTPLSKFARASLTGVPEYAALTPSVRSLQRERLVQSARSMAAAADKYAAALTAAKFPQEFLKQLRAAIDPVQASLDASSAKRIARNGATKKLAGALAQGRRAVAALDSLVAHLIIGDERLEREWESAKRIRRQAAADPAEQKETTVTLRTPASTNGTEVTKAAA